LTDEASNDSNVQSGSVVEVSLIGGDKGGLGTTVESVLEQDGGVGTGSEVESCKMLVDVVLQNQSRDQIK
jgi:hypothetical protein